MVRAAVSYRCRVNRFATAMASKTTFTPDEWAKYFKPMAAGMALSAPIPRHVEVARPDVDPTSETRPSPRGDRPRMLPPKPRRSSLRCAVSGQRDKPRHNDPPVGPPDLGRCSGGL